MFLHLYFCFVFLWLFMSFYGRFPMKSSFFSIPSVCFSVVVFPFCEMG